MSEQRVSPRVVKFAEDVVNQEQRPGSGFLCENARLRQFQSKRNRALLPL